MSGYARVPAGQVRVVVDPDIDVTLGTVVIATPYGNLRGRSFWVTREVDEDTFTIRLSDTRRSPTPFAWIVVENEALRSPAEAARAALEAAATADAEEAEEGDAGE